jgi:hypothetical protein
MESLVLAKPFDHKQSILEIFNGLKFNAQQHSFGCTRDYEVTPGTNQRMNITKVDGTMVGTFN